MELFEKFETLPKLLKAFMLLAIPAIVPLHRIAKYTETKNTVTLVAGILMFIPIVLLVFMVIDIVCEVTNDKVSVLVD